MHWKLIIGGLIVGSSLLASSSVTCQLPGAATQSDPNSCNLTSDHINAFAIAVSGSSYSGNTFTAEVGTSASVDLVGPPVAGVQLYGGAYATAAEALSVPKASVGYTYQVSFTFQSYLSYAGPNLSGFPLSGCVLVFKGEQCAFTLSAAQLSALSTFSMDSTSQADAAGIQSGPVPAEYEQMNLTISQFNSAGSPVNFGVAPEPGTVGLETCALLLTGFALRSRKQSKI